MSTANILVWNVRGLNSRARRSDVLNATSATAQNLAVTIHAEGNLWLQARYKALFVPVRVVGGHMKFFQLGVRS